ncbi:PhoU domain-containing protein [Bacteroidota bacterium]
MQRKVIQLAGKTLVISLPSKWAKNNGIEKGDDIEIEEQEKRLIVSTSKESKADKITLDINEIGYYDPLYIAYLYQAGIDEIKINYTDREVFRKIQEKIPDLMGYEIINQGENYAEIKNVSSALEEEFETMLRRTFYLLEDMGKSSLEAIKNKDYERLKDLIQLEKSVDKFTDFCKRVLTKRGYKNPHKTQFYYVIIRDLEKIGDFYEEIAKQVIETKIIPEKTTLEIYQQANEFLSSFHKLFYKFSKEQASEFQKNKKELNNKTHNIMKTAKKEDLYILYNLASLIKITGNLYGPYFTTTI